MRGTPDLAVVAVEELLEGGDLDDLDLRLALAHDATVLLDQLAQLSAHLLGTALLGEVELAGSLLHHRTARLSTVKGTTTQARP